MAKKSCERCVERKVEMVDHVSCQYFPGDRDRSTFESYAAICKNYTEDKVCGARCSLYNRVCSREKGHKGPHRNTIVNYNNDKNYVTVEWGKVAKKATPKKKER